MPRKTHEEIEEELKIAATQVKVGGTYSHYKNPEHTYTVVSLAMQEATENICVIYRAEYGKKLTFVRDLHSWLENPEVNGVKVPRFKLVE